MICPFLQTIHYDDELVRILYLTNWVGNIGLEILPNEVVRAIKFPRRLGNVSDGLRVHLSKLPGDHLNDCFRVFLSQVREEDTPSKAIVAFEKVDQLLTYCRFP